MAYSRNKMFFSLSTTIMIVLALYTAHRLIWTTAFPLSLKIAATFVILVLSQAMSIMRLLVTGVTGLSFGWIRAGGYASALFMVLGSLTFLRDLLFLLLHAAALLFQEEELNRLAGILLNDNSSLLLIFVSLLCSASGMWLALQVPKVKECHINVNHLPEDLDGLRIVQLSDLHIGSTFKADWLEKVISRCNALHPDLVLITGDLVDSSPAVLADDMRLLLKLQAEHEVLIVVGNHEYYAGMMPWVKTWRDMGLTVLLNQWKAVEHKGHTLVISGIADDDARKYPGLLLPDAKAACAGAPEGFRILMAHQPRHARRHARLGYDLQLSGHTHGGQYFFLFPLISFLNKGYRSGLYEVGDMKLYVSPGTGMWGYVPMRVGSPAEISLLILHPASIRR